ncbi:MAG TPA: Xaa-Pro peptidase family protein [Methanocorpusculum sp.]|uniref:M24 family metallopeptidase n=1 Tax=Methanocorpusculum sp. GPch4 TaxID=2527877 RepID=UPI001432F773|nr:Xaa-Pro peptidase family protein [Methanocorpusculum sp. GPch4]HJJ34847.1 Xaa-Pro peptidase family protein [Methanocorpusculum sp.]
MKRLLEELEKHACDAYVAYDSSDDADMRYLSGFLASDPYIYVFSKDGASTLIVSSMEETRARYESACSIVTRISAGLPELLKKYPDPELAAAHMIRNFAGPRLLIPPSMPVGFARKLTEVAEVIIDSGTIAGIRSIKTEDEIEKIRYVQKKNEIATRAAVDAIRKSEPDDRGILMLEDAPLTSERVRDIIHFALRPFNCEDIDTIVSCGEASSMPHARGTGPLYANQPIVMDVFPRSELTGYFADMTRTVSKGVPSDEIVRMYDAVQKAKELAVSMIRPGVTGASVYSAVVEFFRENGYETAGSSGFTHSLGHGVGLEIHEAPSLSPSGGELKVGHVITLEPGLYYQGIGGVRLEDMGVVTSDGFDSFTCFEEKLVV